MGTEKDWAVTVSEAVNKWLCAQSEEPLSAAIHAALAEAGFVVVKREHLETWEVAADQLLYGTAYENSIAEKEFFTTGRGYVSNIFTQREDIRAYLALAAAPQPPPTLQAREGEAK